MKVTSQGVFFEDYVSASPSPNRSSFTDKDGATLFIETTTLVKMYEIVRFDLMRRGGWAGVMSDLEKSNEA